jgi:NhaP-type Na+/H+ or K+/H+ antiporter
VWTIPVIFGEATGKIIVAFCLFAAFLSTLLFYPSMPAFLFVVILIMSLIGFWVIKKKNFREWQVFLVCAAFAVIFILFFERPLWLLLWR